MIYKWIIIFLVILHIKFFFTALFMLHIYRGVTSIKGLLLYMTNFILSFASFYCPATSNVITAAT